MWFSILKMPNPYGGRWADLTRDEYYRMNIIDKRKYHSAMHKIYRGQIKRAVEPRKAGQAPPATDDQIRGLREVNRFHSRQYMRMRHPNVNKENYYSLEEETNRNMVKPTYDAVEKIPLTTKEMYDNYTREQKYRYWIRLTNHLKDNLGVSHPKSRLANRQSKRMGRNPNYTPPFEGDESTILEYNDSKYRNVSEYDNFTDEEKRKYHERMSSRNKKSDLEQRNFHRRMSYRFKANTNLPTYPTPEAEKEAEQ